MDLKERFRFHGYECQEVADAVGVSPCTISNYCCGRRKPRLDIALAIQELFKGKITVEHIYQNWREKNRKSKK